jgi:hypothetical protein
MRRRILVGGMVAALGAPTVVLGAQVPDSSGMPSLELLITEAGRASRRHPIAEVAPEMLCDPGHPLVDSATVAACGALDVVRRASLTAAFARGAGVSVAAGTASTAHDEMPECPADLERRSGPRVVRTILTAPIVGLRDDRWEARLTVQFRCRVTAAGSSDALRVIAKEYLYQWTGSTWRLYQYAWRRTSR